MVAFINSNNNSVLYFNTFHRSRKILLNELLHSRFPNLTDTAARGMKKFSQESGKKLLKVASDQMKYYVNVAIENQALGHEVNRVTLLTPHEAQAHRLSGTDPRKTLAKLFRSDNWDKLTPNAKKGQLGEDLAKTINESVAQKEG